MWVVGMGIGEEVASTMVGRGRAVVKIAVCLDSGQARPVPALPPLRDIVQMHLDLICRSRRFVAQPLPYGQFTFDGKNWATAWHCVATSPTVSVRQLDVSQVPATVVAGPNHRERRP
jgi:hypothetical protein